MNLPVAYSQSTNQWRNTVLGYTNQLSDEQNQLVEGLKDSFQQNLDYFPVTKNSDTTQYDMLIFDGDRNKKIEGTKNFVSYPYDIPQFSAGDYIHFQYGGVLDTWLITSIDLTQTDDINGLIQRCNYILPFQLSDSTIYKYPCIVSTKRLTAIGIAQNNVMTTPDSQLHIGIPYDQYTSKLVENKRLFIDQFTDKPCVYKITKVDRIMHMDGEHGLLDITCYQDETNYKDRPDLLIANYISSSTPTPPPTPTSSGSCTITMNNGTAYTTVQNIRIGGTGNYFNALFKDTNGNVLANLTPTWTLTDLNGITNSDITVSDVDGYPLRIKVKVTYNATLIGSSFKIHLIDSGNTLSGYDVNCKVVSLS